MIKNSPRNNQESKIMENPQNISFSDDSSDYEEESPLPTDSININPSLLDNISESEGKKEDKIIDFQLNFK